MWNQEDARWLTYLIGVGWLGIDVIIALSVSNSIAD